MNREHNFISAVIYTHSSNDIQNSKFLGSIASCLEEHFEHYEIIVVNNGGGELSHEFREEARKVKQPVTVIKMSLLQTREQCMNAGLDAAIGDYVYEFDGVNMDFDVSLVWEAYQKAVSGSDIVAVCPETEGRTSRMFYRVFNRYSNSAYKLRTSAFRLVSRRALNRVHAINSNLPYRKAAYAASGLKISELFFEGSVSYGNKDSRLDLAADSLVLYTDFGYKFSLGFASAMMAMTAAALLYAMAVWLAGNPVQGWTTTMCVISFGLTGLFAVSAVILKYLVIIVRLIFNRQGYLIEGLEKL